MLALQSFFIIMRVLLLILKNLIIHSASKKTILCDIVDDKIID